MTKLATLALAALLPLAVAPQAWAQEANPEPGFCAQFYPNADCNSIGPAPNKTAAIKPAETTAAVPAPVPTPRKKPKKKPQTSAAAPAAK
jgi:hypothetical protein